MEFPWTMIELAPLLCSFCISLTVRLKNSGCRLLKKFQRQGARKIGRAEAYFSQYVEARRLSATKHMDRFRQHAKAFLSLR